MYIYVHGERGLLLGQMIITEKQENITCIATDQYLGGTNFHHNKITLVHN